MGNYNGSDGLRLKDLHEIKIEDGGVKFEKYPTVITVRSTLSKAKHKYFTFLTKEGCTYLKEYLEERLRKGEKFGPDTSILTHERPTTTSKHFMITRKITHYIRESVRKTGKFNRPYVLRAYAETQLIIAKSKGKISHPYLQFIAGHKGDIESRYSTNKGILPPNMIEDMRKSYEQCESFLGAVAQPTDQMNVIKEAKIEALKSIAKTMFGIDLMEVKVAKEREVGKEVTADNEIELFENEVKKLREAPDPQKVIGERELETYLVQGWQHVTTLPSKRIIIKK